MTRALEQFNSDRYMWFTDDGRVAVTYEPIQCVFDGPDARWPFGYTVASNNDASDDGISVVTPDGPCYAVRTVATLTVDNSAEVDNARAYQFDEIRAALVNALSPFIENQFDGPPIVVATEEGRGTAILWAVRASSDSDQTEGATS